MSSGRPKDGDLQMVMATEKGSLALPPSASGSTALVEYTPPVMEEEEDVEIKLRRILENVPVRVSNTSGSSGSGDFHQYRQMRQKEQDRLARMDADYQRRKELAEYTIRRDERLKAAEEWTAKKRLKRQKKKQRKIEKKSKVNAGGEENENKEGSSDEEDDFDNDGCTSLKRVSTSCLSSFTLPSPMDSSIIDAIKSMSGGKRPVSSAVSGENAVKFQKAEDSSRATLSCRGSKSLARVESGQVQQGTPIRQTKSFTEKQKLPQLKSVPEGLNNLVTAAAFSLPHALRMAKEREKVYDLSLDALNESLHTSFSILTITRQLKKQKETITQMEEKIKSLTKLLQWKKAERAEVASKLVAAEKSNSNWIKRYKSSKEDKKPLEQEVQQLKAMNKELQANLKESREANNIQVLLGYNIMRRAVTRVYPNCDFSVLDQIADEEAQKGEPSPESQGGSPSHAEAGDSGIAGADEAANDGAAKETPTAGGAAAGASEVEHEKQKKTEK